MALNSELARLGVTGAFYTGPLDIAEPSRTAIDAWPDGMKDLGYISDDGITEGRDEDNETFTPWQAFTPIRTEITSSTLTFAATLWESKWDTISLYYRIGLEHAQQTGTGTEAVVSFTEGGKPERDLRSFGIDVIDGAYHRRIFLPMGEVTERGELTYRSDSMIGYEVTITAYPGKQGYSALRIYKEGWELPDGPTTAQPVA